MAQGTACRTIVVTFFNVSCVAQGAACLDDVIAAFCRMERNQTNVPANQWNGAMAVFRANENVRRRCLTGDTYNCVSAGCAFLAAWRHLAGVHGALL